MDYYNIVLLPGADFTKAVTSLISDKFSSVADGYCLSDTVFPHVTLAQFKAEGPVALAVAEEIKSQHVERSLIIKDIYTHPGTDIHQGYIWTGLEIEKTAWLSEQHDLAVRAVDRHGLKPLNSCHDNYYPHLTFCRVAAGNAIPPFIIPPRFQGSVDDWKMVTGKSDMNGQFLGILNDLTL